MLTISFATRTDSTLDPLVERALSLATEFMALSGRFFLPRLDQSNPDQGLSQVLYQTLSISLNHFSGFRLPPDHVLVGSVTGSWKSTAP
jgi:hypothetical protein